MRVNILLDNPAGIRKGFLNIDPFASTTDERITDDFKALNEVDDGEAEEIIAIDIIDYLKTQDAHNAVANWVKKLQHGGILTLAFMDLYFICKAVNNRLLNLEEANIFLHGTQDKPWRLRKSTFTLDYISKLLEGNGLKILLKRIDPNSGRAYIKGMRP
jgi:hypothetical protein